MADGYARVTDRVGVVSVHQGPGLTNTMTGLAEAAKSRTPLLVLAGETPAAALTSNFRIDQHDLVESVGRDRGPRVQPSHRRRRRAAGVSPRADRAPAGRADAPDRHPAATGGADRALAAASAAAGAPGAKPRAVTAAADALSNAQRPAIIAGRGAVIADAGDELEQLGSADRRDPRDLRPGKRPFRRSPLLARDQRRVRVARSPPSYSRRPTSCCSWAPPRITGRRSTER